MDDTIKALEDQLTTATEEALQQAHHELQQRAHELAILNELGQALTARLDVAGVLDEIYRGASRLLDTTNFWIHLYNAQKGELTLALGVLDGQLEKPHLTSSDLKKGVSEYLIQSRQPLLIKDRVQERLSELGIKAIPYASGRVSTSWLGTPIMFGERVVGTMAVLNYTTPGAFDEHDLDLLTAIAGNAAIAIENARLFQEEQRQHQIAESLREVSTVLNRSLDLDTVLTKILEQLQRVVQYDSASVFLRAGDKMVFSSGVGVNRKYFTDHFSLSGVGAGVEAIKRRQPQIIEDVRTDPRWQALTGDESIRSWMGAPLFIGEKGIGLLTVDSFEVGAYGEAEAQVLQIFANQAAIAIHNAQLYQEIQREKQFFETLMLTSPVATVLVDSSANIMLWNPAAELLFGYLQTEVIGRNIDEVVTTTATRAEAVAYTQQMIRNRDRLLHVVTQRNRKDGTLIDVKLSVVPVVIDEELVAYIVTYDDITEIKQAEVELLAAHRELQAKNEQLQELNISKDKFFSIISHDLKSPFTTLIGLIHLIADRVDMYRRDELKNKISTLEITAERLYALLENLLTWSRLQRGVMICKPEVIDLGYLMKENIEVFTPKADEKKITISHSVPQNTTVYADWSMINTVLRNLLSNALKFTEPGGRIIVSANPQEQEVEIAVTDTGQGIDADGLAKLFRIEAHYSKVGTAGEQGTGLGLILCHEIVEKNDGRIWVESEEGKGTTFRFTLPQKPITS